ncbi:MAG: tRNA (N(6)-L-threonylcarbamoyladenosine(37)-C(2))-methylthiotransferase MtaB [Clostridia bacterium]|nr:tRNA (N(6)-L-threonylcarbamoyladenosine(37)-C(2))-methylthiotransferase MtaB [Clostridia bacterium]
MTEKKNTVGIYTLGCKVNQYESEAIAEYLSDRGFEILSPSETCDAYIINTCTVTAESDRKARQFIRRAINHNPSAYIVVTGCFAETGNEALRRIDGVDVIVGNKRKLDAADAVVRLFENEKKNTLPETMLEDIDGAPFEQMSIRRFDRTRAYVKIEDGCENRCTYCVIPLARGRVRSKAMDDVIREVTALTRGGCREVVLTGIETASYGKDLGGSPLLGELLCEVDKIEGIGRVRLGSLDPSLIREPFVETISKLSSLAPHFHLSLQSGSSRILALMKRKYNADQAMAAIELLRANMPEVQFTTDIIVGFPGESDNDFRETYNFLDKAGFLMVHVFPYSKRAGTPAALMKDQIPENIKRERLHMLEELAAKKRAEILRAEIEKRPIRRVLFENAKDGRIYGHTAEFLEVAAESDLPLHGEFADVELTDTDGNICFGRLI